MKNTMTHQHTQAGSFAPLTRRFRAGMLLACLAALMVTGTGAAHAAKAQGEAYWLDGKWPHEKSDLAQHEDAVYGRLESGFRYFLLHHDQPEGRTAMQLDVQAGSLMERDNEAGIAHYLEHMVFNGTENFAPGELIKFFQRHGMSFGGDTNAHTSLTETVFKLDLPTSTPESISSGLTVLADFAHGALILPKEVDKERGIILEEKTARDTVGSRARQRSLDVIYDGTRFVNPTIGTEKVIKGADAALLRGFYDAWYRPENTILVMVGDFDPKAIEPMVRWAFADFGPRAPKREVPSWGDITPKQDLTVHYDPVSGFSPMVMVQNLKQRQWTVDTKARQRQQLAEQLASQALRLRLMRLTTQKDAPILRGMAGMGKAFDLFDNARVMGMCRPGQWKNALTTVEHELRRALEHGFHDAEIAKAKEVYSTIITQGVEEEASTDSKSLAANIITTLNAGYVVQSAEQTQALYAPMIQDITTEEIEQAFRNAWKDGNRILTVTGMDIDAKDPEALIKAQWDKSAKDDVAPYEPPVDVEFPYLATPKTPAKVVSNVQHTELGEPYTYSEVKLDNGITLLMKPRKTQKNTIMIGLGFGTGTALMSEREQALARLAARVVSNSAPGRLTRSEMAQILPGKAIRIGWQSRADTMGISAACLPEDLETSLHLVRAMLRDQHIRPQAMQAAMSTLKVETKRSTDTAQQAMMTKVPRFLSGRPNAIAPITLDDVKGFTLDDVRRFVKEQTAIGPLVITASGDFDPDTLVNLVARTFEGIAPKHNDAKPMELHFPEGQRGSYRLKGDLDQSAVMIGYPVPGAVGAAGAPIKEGDVLRNTQIAVLSSVISDRLRIHIREDLGATYSTFCAYRQMTAFPDFGMLYTIVTTNGAKVQFVERELKKVFANLIEDGITEEEVSRAKRQMQTSRKRFMSLAFFWRMLLDQEAYTAPGAFERTKAYDGFLKQTTAEDLNALAQTYVQPEKAAVFTVLPPKAATN